MIASIVAYLMPVHVHVAEVVDDIVSFSSLLK